MVLGEARAQLVAEVVPHPENSTSVFRGRLDSRDLGFWRIAAADPERIAIVDDDGRVLTLRRAARRTPAPSPAGSHALGPAPR